MTRARTVRVIAAAGIVAGLVIVWNAVGTTLFADLTVSGIVLGAIYALSGLGLVITYRASGVFNFAHGAIAMFVAYVLWQLVRVWHVPVVIAAVVALGMVAPAVGLLLSRYVFRPLDERDASSVEKLVATIGLFILFVGLAVAMWGPETKTDPVSLFPTRSFTLGGVTMSVDQLAIVIVVACLTFGIYLLFDRTLLGLRMRAVVERRELAELSAVRADRVLLVSWAIGTAFAGLTGVLLVPQTFGLDPFHLTLLVAETFAVAVIARLESLSLSVVGGLILGLAASYATQIRFASVLSWLGATGDAAVSLASLLEPLKTSLPVVALFAALFVHRHFAGELDGGRLTQPTGSGNRLGRLAVNAGIVVLLTAAPFVLDTGLERRVQDMMGLAVVFVSIVVVTGIGGHITLGQAAFAGFGAFLTGRLIAGSLPLLPALPVIPATIVAVAVCVPLGVAVGWPALRRRGLMFGLTTFAFGLVLERFVFANYEFTAGPGTLEIRRPALFGMSLSGDVAFHFYLLALLGFAVVAARRLRRGRVGRTLAAMRDCEDAARSVGVRVRRYTLLLFVSATGLAGLGGAMIAQTGQTFASQRFGTFDSFIWFAAVVVAGVTSVHGALLAAFALTVLSSLVGDTGVMTLLVGIGALVLGRLPGGLVGALRTLVTGRDEERRAGPRLAPSSYAREILARSRTRTRIEKASV